MAAPRKGKELRKNVCIRLESCEKELLIKAFGGVQAAVDYLLSELKAKEVQDKKAS